LGSIQETMTGMGRRIKNKMPTTKWPLCADIYTVYDGSRIKHLEEDFLRKDKNQNGDLVFIFKKTGEEILPPSAGLEDIGDTVTLVKVGEGEYRFAKVMLDPKFTVQSVTEKKMDGTPAVSSLDLVFRLYDDEQMKFLFAKKTMDTAWRYAEETPWWKSMVFMLFIFGITMAIMFFIMSSNSSNLTTQFNSLSRQLLDNTNALNGLTNSLGGAIQGGSGVVSGAHP
jgi:hypothetical protein